MAGGAHPEKPISPFYSHSHRDEALCGELEAHLAFLRRSQRIARYLAGRRLSLHPRKTVIRPAAEPAPFLGYVLMPGVRRLPDDNVRRFRNRWRGLRDRVRAGRIVWKTLLELAQRTRKAGHEHAPEPVCS